MIMNIGEAVQSLSSSVGAELRPDIYWPVRAGLSDSPEHFGLDLYLDRQFYGLLAVDQIGREIMSATYEGKHPILARENPPRKTLALSLARTKEGQLLRVDSNDVFFLGVPPGQSDHEWISYLVTGQSHTPALIMIHNRKIARRVEFGRTVAQLSLA